MRRRSSAVILLACLLMATNGASEPPGHSAEQPKKASGATAAVKPPSGSPARLAPAAPPPPKCWEPPPLTNIWDIFQTQASALLTSADIGENERPVLALSSGDMDAAYSAGFVVGWGETGVRPEFAMVSGVGASALVAPFAFIGRAADQALGDLFNCNVGSFKELAAAAASRLDEGALASIARGHRAGRRLYLVTPSTDGRPAVVWDAGRIAASGDRKALAHLRSILAAAVDGAANLEPRQIPIAAGFAAAEEDGLRLTGAGGLFYVPEGAASSPSKKTPHYFLINNGKLRARENHAFMQFVVERHAASTGAPPGVVMTSSFGVYRRARKDRSPFHFALVPASLPVTPQYEEEIDFDYSREVFMRAWKTARTGGGWQTRLPGFDP